VRQILLFLRSAGVQADPFRAFRTHPNSLEGRSVISTPAKWRRGARRKEHPRNTLFLQSRGRAGKAVKSRPLGPDRRKASCSDGHILAD
jgi:hypothetical protein